MPGAPILQCKGAQDNRGAGSETAVDALLRRAAVIAALVAVAIVDVALPLWRVQAPDPTLATEARQLAQARQKLRHVVFVLLENRTSDQLFDRYPPGDGTTEGKLENGQSLPLACAGRRPA